MEHPVHIKQLSIICMLHFQLDQLFSQPLKTADGDKDADSVVSIISRQNSQLIVLYLCSFCICKCLCIVIGIIMIPKFLLID